MKKLLFSLLILGSLSASAQKDTTLTDSTVILTVKDMNKVLQFLEDKLIAKDYNLVKGTLEAVTQEALIRRKKK
jgi:hypothetical protein